jgi:homoserine O-acetyltransferase
MRSFIIVMGLIWLFQTETYAQPAQKFAQLGDFKTESGGIIKNCKLGYRTLGKLNQNKSNVVLWPTWFTGTSETVYPAVLSLIDTTGLYIIIADSFGNGVSSSPSNTSGFPGITIRDMVRAEYQMLTGQMKISHLHTIMGISMGGMQTFEWLSLYPDFIDSAIPIVGTPKQTFYDNLVWESCVKVIEESKQEGRDMNKAMQTVMNIQLMNMYSPAYWNNNYSADKLYGYLADAYKTTGNPDNVLSQLKAMIHHDIYNVRNQPLEIKCKMLVVVARQDHLVNPSTSLQFAEKYNIPTFINEHESGHMSTVYDAPTFRKELIAFMKK